MFNALMKNETRFKWALVTPAIIVLAIFAIFPTIFALKVSFQSYVLSTPWPAKWIGFGNYRDLLIDPAFLSSLGRTFMFSALAISIELTLGLAVALLLNREFRAQGLVRGLCLLPVVTAPLAGGLIWRYMYDYNFGIMNYFVRSLGLEPIEWLSARTPAFFSVLIFDIWHWTPLVIFVLLAGLRGLPRDPFEAARVDGASAWFRFRTLTLPMLKPIIIIIGLLRLIRLLRFYDPLFALTRGGPGSATETVNWYIYKIGFKYFDMGFASAMAVFVMYLIIVISAIVFKQLINALES